MECYQILLRSILSIFYFILEAYSELSQISEMQLFGKISAETR